MLTFFFITVVGLSGLFTPLLKKSSEPMFQNFSFSLNISETSKWKPSFIFKNITAPIWKQGWRGRFDSSSKFKNISSRIVSAGTAATFTNRSKWNINGWSEFAKKSQMKLRQHFENFKGKFRSETRTSVYRNVTVEASSPRSFDSGVSRIVNITVQPSEADETVSRTWTHATTHTERGQRHGVAETRSSVKITPSNDNSNGNLAEFVDNRMIEKTEQEVRTLGECVQNFTEAAHDADQHAEKAAKNETAKLKLEVRRMEKELKLLARDPEARTKLRDELTVKKTRLQRYQRLCGEIRDKRIIIEATKRGAEELAAEVRDVLKAAKEFGKPTGENTKKRFVSSEELERLRSKMQAKMQELDRTRARVKISEDLEKGLEDNEFNVVV